MDTTTTIWNQGIGVGNNENNDNNNKSMEVITPKRPTIERNGVRPQKDQPLNCPRCNSTNTKFCYYNNYSLSQPRHFCKTCKRYWTQGGSIRNVPIGGNSRKNHQIRKPSSSKKIPILLQSPIPLLTPPVPQSNSNTTNDYVNHLQNPNLKIQETQDLNLAYPSFASSNYMSKFVLDLPCYATTTSISNLENPTNPSSTTLTQSLPSFNNNVPPLMELPKNGIMSSTPTLMGGLMTNLMYSSGLFPVQEFKPRTITSSPSNTTTTIDFPFFEGLGSGSSTTNASARLLFPLQAQRNTNNNHNGEASHQYCWSGM